MIFIPNKNYVYLHINKSNGNVFYVGKGSGKRAYDIRNRNYHWNNIVKKYGFDVNIVADNLTNEEAFLLEMRLISFYGINNLTNMTIGGDGCIGLNSEGRIKLSNSLKEFYRNNQSASYIKIEKGIELKIIDLYKNGNSVRDISILLNISLWNINKTLKKYQIQKRVFLTIDKDYFYDLYVTQNIDYKQLTKILNCSKSNIHRIAKKYGIKKREILKNINITNGNFKSSIKEVW